MARNTVLAAALAVALAACSTSEPVQNDVQRPAPTSPAIDPSDFLLRVGILAHDSMAGRATPSPGLEAAAGYIASELERLGLRGGGDAGGFLQWYETPSGDGPAPNAVGILDGRDPELRDEYVVLSAHMDHVGMREPDESGDSIWNGADDNASGTAAVLEVAEAMADLDPGPRRSVVFLLVSGEERGLWGSAHFAANPPVPLEAMVANVNADMVGRNWTDTIVAIGKEHSDLGATLERVNAAHPELGMTAIDDLWPEENFYRRSDHFNFARRGVPALFFFNGVHEDYHGRDDEVEKILEDKASRVARLMHLLVLEVADADEPPQWNPESYREIVEQGR
jgi:hypothetical protein